MLLQSPDSPPETTSLPANPTPNSVTLPLSTARPNSTTAPIHVVVAAEYEIPPRPRPFSEPATLIREQGRIPRAFAISPSPAFVVDGI